MIGSGWTDGAWIDAGWVTGAWASGSTPVVAVSGEAVRGRMRTSVTAKSRTEPTEVVRGNFGGN